MTILPPMGGVVVDNGGANMLDDGVTNVEFEFGVMRVAIHIPENDDDPVGFEHRKNNIFVDDAYNNCVTISMHSCGASNKYVSILYDSNGFVSGLMAIIFVVVQLSVKSPNNECGVRHAEYNNPDGDDVSRYNAVGPAQS